MIYMTLYTSLLQNTTPIHCTPDPLHPPLQSIQDRQPAHGRKPGSRMAKSLEKESTSSCVGSNKPITGPQLNWYIYIYIYIQLYIYIYIYTHLKGTSIYISLSIIYIYIHNIYIYIYTNIYIYIYIQICMYIYIYIYIYVYV